MAKEKKINAEHLFHEYTGAVAVAGMRYFLHRDGKEEFIRLALKEAGFETDVIEEVIPHLFKPDEADKDKTGE